MGLASKDILLQQSEVLSTGRLRHLDRHTVVADVNAASWLTLVATKAHERRNHVLYQPALTLTHRADDECRRRVKDTNVSFVGAGTPIVTGTTIIFVRELY